jgi:hypothetical protein
MKLALGIVVVLGLIALLAVLLPVRVRATLKGRGQFGDTWVIAGGLELLKFTVSVAAAHATERILQVHFFSWRVLTRRWSPEQGEKPDAELGELFDKLKVARGKLERYFDRDQVWRFVLGLRRYARVKRFEGNLTYCTPDVALTGVLSGALYAIAGLAAPIGSFAIVPEWEDVARARGEVDLVVRLQPGRAVVATAWFVMKNIRLRERAAAETQVAARALPAQS